MVVLGWFALTIVSFLLNGVALKFLWSWFMVPTFGLPVISLVQAIGIGIIIGFMTQQYVPKDKDEVMETALYEIVIPIFTLAVGWIIHLFM